MAFLPKPRYRHVNEFTLRLRCLRVVSCLPSPFSLCSRPLIVLGFVLGCHPPSGEVPKKLRVPVKQLSSTRDGQGRRSKPTRLRPNVLSDAAIEARIDSAAMPIVNACRSYPVQIFISAALRKGARDGIRLDDLPFMG